MNEHLIDYTLHLADTTLILGHRNSEWCGHGPVLEQDIALTNISLDLIGQARNFYQYAALLTGPDCTEDKLAYHRDANDFKNTTLAEQPNGDWAHTILRQFFYSNHQFFLYTRLQQGSDQQIAAIAAKSLKEVNYHLRWSSEWVIRLGDGTSESHQRMEQAIASFYPYTAEFFEPAGYEIQAFETGVLPNLHSIKQAWEEKTNEIFSEARLTIPGGQLLSSKGKQGQHSAHLETLLAEMQSLPRTYPDAVW